MIIAANLKTNHTQKSFKSYISQIITLETSSKIRIFPPFTAFSYTKLPLHVKIGAQNFYPVNSGSYTGEIGAQQLEEFDIRSVLIGHCERRNILKESDELIAEKFHFAKEKGWEIIFCIGESKSIRDKGDHQIVKYLHNKLKDIDTSYENLIIAYEPVWAIGTGDVAQVKDVKTVLDSLRQVTNAPLLYGGSVSSKNIKNLCELSNCDGVLVGTASWKIESFCEIIKKAN